MSQSLKLKPETKKDLWGMIVWRLCKEDESYNRKINTKEKSDKPNYSNFASGYTVKEFEDITNTINDYLKNQLNKKIQSGNRTYADHFGKVQHTKGLSKGTLEDLVSFIFAERIDVSIDEQTFINQIRKKIATSQDLKAFLQSENSNSTFLLSPDSKNDNLNTTDESTKILSTYVGTYKSYKPSLDGKVWIYYWKLYLENNKGKVKRPSHTGFSYDGTFQLHSQLHVLSILLSTGDKDYKSTHHYLAEIKEKGIFKAVCTGIFNNKPIIEDEWLVKVSDNPEHYDEIPDEKKHVTLSYADFINNTAKKEKHLKSDFLGMIKEFLKPQKVVALRLCHTKYLYLSDEVVYNRKVIKPASNGQEVYEVGVKSEYLYTKVIKYSNKENERHQLSVDSKKHIAIDSAYEKKNGLTEMEILYPNQKFTYDRKTDITQKDSKLTINAFKDDIVVSAASYLNDTNIEWVEEQGGEIVTGIRFREETEKGVLIVDFTSLPNFQDLDIRISKLIYERGIDDVADYVIPDASNFYIFSIVEPTTNQFEIIPLRTGIEKKGLFRIEINTEINLNDHIILYFIQNK